jgi:predicted glycoside hydrolase/deacetylase ChbG (UPF0249 family)
MPSTLKPLIVCADDFGIEPGVDTAIVDLAQSGRLSATGCLVTAVRFPEAAPLLSGLPVDIGLHLNFTECLGIPGFYAPLGKLIALTYTRRISRSQVRGQINTQLDLFEQHVKRVPDFVDGHLHVHQFPVIREELLGALTERFGQKMPWLRDTQPTQMSHALPFMQRFKAHVIGALGAGSLVQQATRVGAIVNDGFMGAYDFSRPHPPYLVMLAEWLKHARINSLLMTHPAQFASENLAFGRDRIEEYRVLGSEDFIALLKKNQLTIARLSQSGISQ